MRERDADELECQAPEGMDALDLGLYLAEMPGYVVYTGDRVPALMFGAAPISGVAVTVWSIGTPRVGEVLGVATRFIRRLFIPEQERLGYRWAEARVADANIDAKRWMRALGARETCAMPGYGRNRENFSLFTWRTRV